MATEIKAVSRRNMLIGVAVAGGAAALVASRSGAFDWANRQKGVASSWWTRQNFRLETAGRAEWSRLVGTDFYVRSETGNSQFRLVSIEPLPSEGNRPSSGAIRDQAFAATFRLRGGKVPSGNRMYPAWHPEYSDMSIFFDSTVGARRLHMTAIFN